VSVADGNTSPTAMRSCGVEVNIALGTVRQYSSVIGFPNGSTGTGRPLFM
jgi:hypothetical protein